MTDKIKIAAEVVSAFVTKNPIPAAELPELIRAVGAAFANLDRAKIEPDAASKPVPPVPVKKTVHREFLISLEDGKHYKSLKRHLAVRGMTPDEYRAKWGLPKDYPIVARGYSEARGAMAKARGLNVKSSRSVDALGAVEEVQAETQDQAGNDDEVVAVEPGHVVQYAA